MTIISQQQVHQAFVKTPQMVREFHEVFEHPVRLHEDLTCSLDETRALERVGYLTEECHEGMLAAMAGKQEEALDAVGDIAYFLAGNIVECGGAWPQELESMPHNLVASDDTMTIKRMQKHLENYGKNRYLAQFFVGMNASVSELFIENVDPDAAIGESVVETLYPSAGMLMSALFVMGAVFNVDPLEVMSEIHSANMSKLLPAYLPDEKACLQYMIHNGTNATYSELDFYRIEDGRWIAKNVHSHKVVKNPLFDKPDMSQFLTAVELANSLKTQSDMAFSMLKG